MKEPLNYSLYNNLYSGEILYYNRKNNAHERYQMYLQQLLHSHVDAKIVESVLDIACGAGVKTSLIAKDFPQATVLGTDFAEQGIEKAKIHFQNISNLDFKMSNAEDTIVEKYDLISAFEIIEHLEDWNGFLKNITQVSKHYVILSTPIGRMRNSDYKVGHLRNFKVGEIEEQMSEFGFCPVKLFYAGFPFWSPISRDLISITYENRDHLSRKKINRMLHEILYFLYKNCCSKKHGDQFIGLFEKK